VRGFIATALLAAGFTATAHAAEEQIEVQRFPLISGLEQVDSIPNLTRLHSWTAVDDATLIVWLSPSQPYLVQLHRPARELRFAQVIGVTSFGSRIHARFDSVQVDGFSYPIRGIYKMGRDEAKELRSNS
jgi:hypothetical protein